VRIADRAEDSQTLQDAAATWLLGHTESLTFGIPYVKGDDLLVDATIHVPCKHLKDANGASSRAVGCAVHGFRGRMPRSSLDKALRPQFDRGGERYRVFYKRRIRVLPLPLKRAARRALPIVSDANPCATAPCRTADNKHGAACCRDLTLDVVLTEAETEMEALLRARKSPYLCKVNRENETTVECEVISACGYLGDDGISCVLHDRLLPNGRNAKPSICYEWPDLGPDDAGHPGCALL
jgi:hypothetical protein